MSLLRAGEFHEVNDRDPVDGLGRAADTVDGVVFTVDANGGNAVIPTARISLDGPTHIETESDGAGKFTFNAVPPGPTR